MTQNVWKGWCEVILEKHAKQRENSIIWQIRTKALAMMMGKNARLLCEAIVRSWSFHVQDNSAKMQRAARCLTALMGGQGRLMTQNVWKGWCEIILEKHAKMQRA